MVAEYADNRIGRKYVVDTSGGVGKAVTTGVGDYVKAYSTWAYAHQAFDGWALDLRHWLDGVQQAAGPMNVRSPSGVPVAARVPAAAKAGW